MSQGSGGCGCRGFQGGTEQTPDFWNFLQVGGSSDPTVWRGVLGDILLYHEDPGQVSSQGGLLTEKDAAKEDRDG